MVALIGCDSYDNDDVGDVGNDGNVGDVGDVVDVGDVGDVGGGDERENTFYDYIAICLVGAAGPREKLPFVKSFQTKGWFYIRPLNSISNICSFRLNFFSRCWYL